MKKGIYYVPLFLVILLNCIGCLYLKNYYGFSITMVALLLLGEVYYLRFLK